MTAGGHTWRYVLRKGVLAPLIPVRLMHGSKVSPLFWGLLDSGSDRVAIPKRLADLMEARLTEMPMGIITAAGHAKASTCVIDLELGFPQGTERFQAVCAIVVDTPLTPILIGRAPVFKEFDVLFKESMVLIKLTREIVE
jgi:predicted aspartyl protease